MVIDELRMHLEESSANCISANLSLGTVVTEKEQLAKENRDLKEVCEELMAILEAGKFS